MLPHQSFISRRSFVSITFTVPCYTVGLHLFSDSEMRAMNMRPQCVGEAWGHVPNGERLNWLETGRTSNMTEFDFS